MIEFKMDSHGGFYAADTETRLIKYAYPSSMHANEAKKDPAKTAQAMIACETGVQSWQGASWWVPRWLRMYAAMREA
jgi:hypothetical protein